MDSSLGRNTTMPSVYNNIEIIIFACIDKLLFKDYILNARSFIYTYKNVGDTYHILDIILN